jgi:hypothetical protein
MHSAVARFKLTSKTLPSGREQNYWKRFRVFTTMDCGLLAVTSSSLVHDYRHTGETAPQPSGTVRTFPALQKTHFYAAHCPTRRSHAILPSSRRLTSLTFCTSSHFPSWVYFNPEHDSRNSSETLAHVSNYRTRLPS